MLLWSSGDHKSPTTASAVETLKRSAELSEKLDYNLSENAFLRSIASTVRPAMTAMIGEIRRPEEAIAEPEPNQL